MNKKIIFSLIVFTCISLNISAEPLATETGFVREHGTFDVGCYLQVLSTKENPYISLKGDTVQFPFIKASLGFGNRVEFELLWPSLIFWNGKSGNDHTFGDARLFTKISLKQTDSYAVAFKMGFKLPNTSDDSLLGTDKTDVFASLIYTKVINRAQLHSNLGIGILGDPYKERSQVDVLTYATSLEYRFNKILCWCAEVYGYSDEKFWTDLGVFRTGMQFSFTHFKMRTSALVGYTSKSPDWGIEIGFTKTFKVKL